MTILLHEGRKKGRKEGKGTLRKERKDTTGRDKTGQDRTGQDRTGQDRTGQDRTGQDRTGREPTAVVIGMPLKAEGIHVFYHQNTFVD